MDNKEYDYVVSLVEKEFNEKNIGNLKVLKRLVSEKIKRLEEYDYLGESKFILLQRYEDFYAENFNVEEKMQYQLRLLGAIYADINYTKIRKLRIFQTIGIDEGRILSHPGCGKATLAIYEKKLNNHGLSINDYISSDKYKELVKECGDDGPKLCKSL